MGPRDGGQQYSVIAVTQFQTNAAEGSLICRLTVDRSMVYRGGEIMVADASTIRKQRIK